VPTPDGASICRVLPKQRREDVRCDRADSAAADLPHDGRSHSALYRAAFEGTQLYGDALPLNANRGIGPNKIGHAAPAARALAAGNAVVVKPPAPPRWPPCAGGYPSHDPFRVGGRFGVGGLCFTRKHPET
jgi:hypothetical protein